MLNIYSHDEIVAYVDARLKKMGTAAINDRRLNASFVNMLSRLPPEFLTILIESGNDSVVGDPEEINRVYRGIDKDEIHEAINGVFLSGKREIDNFTLKNPSLIRRSEGGGVRVRTARHEKGHDIDLLVGAFHSADKKTSGFFSATSQEWQEALKREIAHQSKNMPFAEKSPDDILSLPKETMESYIAAEKKPEKLYDDYRPLFLHLSHYSTKESRTVETFAEMCTHYTTLYDQTGGRMSAIDMTLSGRYPELWPHFRDEVLPHIEAVAQEMAKTRGREKRRYAVAEKELADAWSLPYSYDESVRDAGIALVDGTFAERIEDFARLGKFFLNPVDNYAAAMQACDDLYYQHDPYSVDDIDDMRDRAIAMDILQEEGQVGIGNAFLHVERERRGFESFVAAYNSRLAQISPDYTVDTYFELTTPKETAVSYYKKLFEKGGDAAIRKHIEGLPTEENVAQFYGSYICWERMIGAISGKAIDLAEYTESIAERSVLQLRSMIESRRYNPAVVRTININNDRTAFAKYSLAFVEFERNLFVQTNSVMDRVTGIEILERYQKIKAIRGLNGIYDEIEKINISPEDIKEYVEAGTAYWDWSRQFDLDGKNVPMVKVGGSMRLANPSETYPEDLYLDMTYDISDAVLNGGKPELMRIKRNLEAQTRSIIRRVQGIEDIPDPLEACNQAADPDGKAVDEDMLRTMRAVIARGLDIQ